jgi:hypothetical protein
MEGIERGTKFRLIAAASDGRENAFERSRIAQRTGGLLQGDAVG